MNKICLIGGTGRMGSLVNDILTKAGYETRIVGSDTDNGEELIKESDAVFLIVPLESFLDDLSLLKDKLVVDFSSCVSPNISKLREVSDRVGYIHLLFGPDVTSLNNQNIVVSSDVEDELFADIVKVFEDEGVNITKATPEDHDRMMSFTQALSQFSTISLAKTLSEGVESKKDLEKFSTITSSLNFTLISRIVSQNSGLWAGIQFENPLFKEVLDSHIENIRELSRFVDEKDYESFRKEFVKLQDFWKDGAESITEEKVMDKVPDSDFGTLGPEGSYSSEAVVKYDKRVNPRYYGSIKEVLEALDKGEIKKALLPFENSIHGTVTETIDGVYYKDLKIIDDVVLDINHNLVGIDEQVNNEDVKYVYSHPQALGQCKNYLENNFPNAKFIHTTSTSGAMQKIVEDGEPTSLAIGSLSAAKKYGLKVLDAGIQDMDNNQTHFVLVSKEYEDNGLPYSIFVIKPDSDKSGVLFNILRIFKDHDINLSKIESRPERNKLGRYIFYLKADVTTEDDRFKGILEEIESGAVVKLITN